MSQSDVLELYVIGYRPIKMHEAEFEIALMMKFWEGMWENKGDRTVCWRRRGWANKKGENYHVGK